MVGNFMLGSLMSNRIGAITVREVAVHNPTNPDPLVVCGFVIAGPDCIVLGVDRMCVVGGVFKLWGLQGSLYTS